VHFIRIVNQIGKSANYGDVLCLLRKLASDDCPIAFIYFQHVSNGISTLMHYRCKRAGVFSVLVEHAAGDIYAFRIGVSSLLLFAETI
jgi:hypothetical protein